MSVRLLIPLLCATLACAPVLADYDPELERQEAAERAAEERAQRARKAETDAMLAAARAKAEAAQMAEKRRTLGAAAKGKNDAEVQRLYDAHVANKTAEANAAMDQLRSGAGAEMLKQATGKSLDEIQGMSEAELEAMGAALEAKYGSGD